jgi:hypothetical protein
MKKLIEKQIGTVSDEAYRFAFDAMAAKNQVVIDRGMTVSNENILNQVVAGVEFYEKWKHIIVKGEVRD